MVKRGMVPYPRRVVSGDVAKFDGNCNNAANDICGDMKQIATRQSWLTVVIRGLKSSITKFAHENNIPFAWQTRFHDRIVRNQGELNRIALYIERNVAKWYEEKSPKQHKIAGSD